MQITEIVVSAGRTFNHPYESYSNLKPAITIKATIVDGEDAFEITKQLQRKAEQLVEDHKNNLLQGIREMEVMSSAMREMNNLEAEMERAQERLDQIRKMYPEFKHTQIEQKTE